MGYTLRNGLHYCIAGGQVTLLDLAADRYFGLPELLEQAFLSWVDAANTAAPDDVSFQSLIKKGILVQGASATRPGPVAIEPPGRSALEQRSSPTHPFQFIEAVGQQIWADRQLKHQPLEKIVAQLRKRKQSHAGAPVCEPRADMVDLAAAFLKTGQLVSAQDQCLRRSIALINYLAGHRHFPEFVIAVRRKPFAAHAWVQWGDMVLNDTVDNVAQYTPILVV